MEYALNIPNTEYSLELSNVTICTSSYTAGTGIDITDSVISVKTEELSYEDLQDKPEIPTKTSELTNDSGFITISSVPTKTSELQNDSGFITQHQSLAAYRTSAAQDIIDANKQDKLTAGSNVTISNNVISASDTTYTAGSNVSISSGNVISATDTTYTAGENIQINGSTISATNTTYTAGDGIDITNNEISVYVDGQGLETYDGRVRAKVSRGVGYYSDGSIGATKADNTILVTDDGIKVNPDEIQEKLTAGTNISISSNTISALPDSSKLDATKCTIQTTAPTQDISDGGVHIVYLTSEPATKYSGYIYLIQEA